MTDVDAYGDSYVDSYGTSSGTGETGTPTTGGGTTTGGTTGGGTTTGTTGETGSTTPQPPVVELPAVITDTGYTQATEDFYESLPYIYRELDPLQPIPNGGYPLKKWVAGLTEQLGQIEAVIDAADYEPADSRELDSQADSQLTDPDTAPVQWLPWVGQLVGVQVNTLLSEAEQRDQVRGAVSGFSGGTKKALIAAAQSALTGTRHVELYDHSINNPHDGGGEWDVLVVTRTNETPSPAAVLQAIADKRAKPAGVLLHMRSYQASWDQLATSRPTWADWDGKTWTQVEETGIQ